jgi:PAS domain S-box-containing protein
MLAATLALPALPAPGDPRPAWLGAYLAVVVVQWTATSLIVAVRLWRAGRGQPTAARRRMRGLSMGAAGLSLVILVAGAAPSVSSRLLRTATDVVTLASALMFYLAFAPPAILRNAWRQTEQAMLRSAMGELKTATRPAEVAACLLPHVVGMVGGRGAALVEESGAVLGTVGETPDDEPQVRFGLSSGWLLVWGSPYTPVFGRQELELLRALGSLADLALERLRVANRDAELAAVVDASGDAIVSTGLDGTIRSWNPAAEAIYGRPAAQAVGQPFSALVPPDRAGQADDLLRRVAKGERVSLETRHLGGDGEPFSVSLTAAPLHGGGTVLGMSVVARDISERRRAEKALREAKQEAERANRAKSEYLSRMSHELRTPLNAILGFAQLLELEELATEQRENLGYILSAARHLLALINEVLDIAAIEAGRLPLSLEPVAVAEVVAEAVSLIRPLADQHQVLLVSPPTECQVHVLGDRQRLKQILLNLLSNAVKYNRQGGSVQLGCGPVADGRLRIEVVDTGPGIAPEAMGQLFVPFERLGSEQTGVEGAGLGLPLSRRLAEAMGGTLEVASTVGQGSSFWVELPPAESPVERAERRQELAEAAAPEPDPAPSESLTVLYIEDNLSNLQLVERVLNRRPGVRLISAMRPQLGLELAAEHDPDLILLDLHLPDMPGQEVLRRLQAEPRTARVPVVILSADARPSLIKELLGQGVRAFLTKPLDVKELLELLDGVAGERRDRGAPLAAGG